MSWEPGNSVLVLDFGSQYTQIIARRVREMMVYCEIHRFDEPADRIAALRPSGIILSGGPSSVYEPGAPHPDARVFDLGIPVLGICYGMQVMAHMLGGRVESLGRREYGLGHIGILERSGIFADIDGHGPEPVWLSHGDRVTALPPGFVLTARSTDGVAAAMRSGSAPIFGVQFHPEVAHTPRGSDMLRAFVFGACRSKPTWDMGSFVESACRAIRDRVGKHGDVLCALSGGVDSSVVAMLVHRAVPGRLVPVFVDNGVLRKGEAGSVLATFRDRLGLPVRFVDAGSRFLARLAGIEDPERKRKVIGEEFIRVFEEQAASAGNARFLAQGTLYPDVIESVSFKGPSATIKSHHNVGGLPERMRLELVEPLRELFKDEVRQVGRVLGLDEEIVSRQPFPGPGLAVRILGEVTAERVATLQGADAIFREEISAAPWHGEVWQSFAALLPVRTVGVMGDQRTYGNVIALRAVRSVDGMTADPFPIPHDVLARVSTRVINEVPGVNRVVYDVSSKPPATIEWE